MALHPEKDSSVNYEIFRECVSKAVVQRPDEPTSRSRRRRKASRSSSPAWTESHNPEEMAEFIDYVAGEAFSSLPEEVQSLSYEMLQDSKALASKFSDPIAHITLESLSAAVDLSVSDTLCVYGLIPESSEFPAFLHQIFREYIAAVTAPPPPWHETRTTACQICGRDWIPLTYHHLIPKEVHAKALKRNWHPEWLLNSVAWLCRACHNFVHRMASNEELAREWYTVEKILQRDDVQDWARWASRLRWKAR